MLGDPCVHLTAVYVLRDPCVHLTAVYVLGDPCVHLTTVYVVGGLCTRCLNNPVDTLLHDRQLNQRSEVELMFYFCAVYAFFLVVVV